MVLFIFSVAFCFSPCPPAWLDRGTFVFSNCNENVKGTAFADLFLLVFISKELLFRGSTPLTNRFLLLKLYAIC